MSVKALAIFSVDKNQNFIEKFSCQTNSGTTSQTIFMLTVDRLCQSD
jgi:hypothetical protein